MDASRLVKAAAALTAGVVVLLIGAVPARAAMPDHWAFAYLDNANPPAAPTSWVMDPARQAGTFQAACPGSTAIASSIGPGGYRVTFPCIGSAGGIAHVTTVDP